MMNHFNQNIRQRTSFELYRNMQRQVVISTFLWQVIITKTKIITSSDIANHTYELINCDIMFNVGLIQYLMRDSL